VPAAKNLSAKSEPIPKIENVAQPLILMTIDDECLVDHPSGSHLRSQMPASMSNSNGSTRPRRFATSAAFVADVTDVVRQRAFHEAIAFIEPSQIAIVDHLVGGQTLADIVSQLGVAWLA
jgi:hypothetical protein